MLAAFTACSNDDITINFYADDELLESVVLDSESSIPDINPPNKEGYVFEGWYTDKNFSNEFNPSQEIEQSLNLYAKYSLKTYTVTFSSEESEDITRTVNHGQSLTDIPQVPQKEGYIGAWEQADLNSITSDLTINAIYTIKEYTVTFRASGFDDIIKTVDHNDTLTDIPQVPQKEGKTGQWDRDDFTMITEDIVVNAVYTDIMITVNFISQLGEQTHLETVEILYNDSITSSQEPEPYIYEGHYARWEEKDLSNLKEDIDVYAVYTPFTYDISFYNWENTLLTVIETHYGDILADTIANSDLDESLKNELLDPEVPSHLNDPINTNFRYGNKSHDADIYTPVTIETNYTLIYDSTIKITIFANGGELADTIDFTDGEEKEVTAGFSPYNLEVKQRYGYEFMGWYTADDYDPDSFPDTAELTEMNIMSPLYENTMIIAEWEKIYINVSFPDIDGITFLIDETAFPDGGIEIIEFGANISFTIDTQTNIQQIIANTEELNQNQDVYTLNQVEQNTVISVKTADIDVHTLRFFNEDRMSLLHTYKINHNQILTIIPDIPSIYGAHGQWVSDLEGYTFETPVTQDIDFELFYEYSYYPVYYHFHYDSSYEHETVQYGDTSFRFLSPPPRSGYLFDGWYVSPQFVERATVEYVINMGRRVNLYANWVEEKDYTHPIIGKWYSDNFILHFHDSGLVQINDHDHFFECSYAIINEKIFILDKEIIFDGDYIVYEDMTFEKSTQPLTIIKFTDIGYYTIVGDEIPYIEDIFEYYWYTDNQEYTQMFDLYSQIDFELIDNNFIQLYKDNRRLVNINYDPLDGNTQFNISSQNIYITSSNTFQFSYYDQINDLPTAFLDNYHFAGWVISGTKVLVDKSYLINNYRTNLNVEAYYVPLNIEYPQNTLEGFYYKYDENENTIITAEFFDDGSYWISFIDALDNSFYRYIPLYYYWSDNEFYDENDNLIIPDGDTITFFLNGQQINMEKPLYDTQDLYHFYPLSDDKYDLIEFEQNNLLINRSKKINAVQLGSRLYYIDTLEFMEYDEEIFMLETYDIDDFIALNDQIPSLYLGSFEGELTITPDEGGEEIHYDIEIIVNSDNTIQLIYNSDNGEQESSALVFYFNEQLYIIESYDKFYLWYDENEDIFILDTIIFEIELVKII